MPGIRAQLLIGIIALSSLSACVPLVVGTAATGATVLHDRRTAGTMLDDQRIKISILNKVAKDERFKDSNINVTSYNNNVLLTGEVPTKEVGLAAASIARDVEKVRQVHNELVIAKPSLLRARSNDSLITASVKSALLAIDLPGFDPTRVKVVTERKAVYLLGLVTSEEAHTTSERARRVSGVEKVIRLFEIVPPRPADTEA